MNKRLLSVLTCLSITAVASAQSTFTAGNLVVLQTSATASKASSPAVLKEYTTAGVPGLSVAIPLTGTTTPFQTAGAFGGSEGFLTTSTDSKYLLLAGYATAATFADITATTAGSVPRTVGTVAPSGFYLQVDTSNVFYSANDIRGAISDGTSYWASGASNASVDGINYFGPGTPVALAGGTSPAKAYGLRIFNGQIYYSTQKSGPSNSSSQLGIFSLGGLPTSGTAAPAQIINTGSNTPTDFSFNAAGDVCYVAINTNTAAGGIQKWTRSGTTWSLAYTLGTGTANIGAYGLIVDYTASVPVIYATTFEAAGNRVIRIADNGTLAGAGITTIVPAVSGVYNKGISFAPVASGLPVVNLTVSSDTASESGQTMIIVKANASFPVTGNQTVALNVSGTGITTGDYTLSTPTITIPAGATSGVDTFRVVDDVLVEGTEVAVLTLATPSAGITLGPVITKSITITDNDAPGPPAIGINVAATTDFIDGGVTTAPASPYKVSGVNSDPTDPAATLGISFNVATTQATGILSLTASSSNTTVVPVSNIVISGSGGLRNVKITPAAVGYATITLMLKDGFDSSKFVISYAASAASATPANTLWHTGMSDASDAIALDDDYFISGDDELNVLNVYSRTASGLPLVSYNYTSGLALPEPTKPEVDIEAATRSRINPGRVYWLGSMSNGKSPFDNKPNRDRIFATTVTGTGAATTFSVVGYAALRAAIIRWGDAAGYNFTASAAAGVDSKITSGFAAEGMVFGPDSTTLYIAFRAPLVPTTTRTKAVIAPVTNFETWFNNGMPSGNPTFGQPIELDLGGRGFRDLIRLSNGTYIIVAGDPGSTNLSGALYKWTGRAGDLPLRIANPAGDSLNMEGAMEVHTGGLLSTTKLQIVTDKGGDVLYRDGIEAKDFGDLQLRKFRSDMLTALDLTIQPSGVQPVNNNNTAQLDVYPNASEGPVNIRFRSETREAYQIIVSDVSGRVSFEEQKVATIGINQAAMELGHLPKGIYLVQVSSASFNYYQKLVLR